MALSPLLNLPSPRYGIDFMAFAKGRELANELNWRDELRQEERAGLYDRMDQADANRTAVAYLATLQGNLQAATAAGMSPSDFIIQQSQQIQADPNFQNFPPEVQSRILSALTDSAAVHMAGLHNAGNLNEADRVASAFGLTSPVSPVELALQTGDAGAIAGALQQQFGMDLNVSPDGTSATVLGQEVPLAHLLQNLSKAPIPASLYAPTAEALNFAVLQKRAEEEAKRQQALFEQYQQGIPGVPPVAGGAPTGGLPSMAEQIVQHSVGVAPQPQQAQTIAAPAPVAAAQAPAPVQAPMGPPVPYTAGRSPALAEMIPNNPEGLSGAALLRQLLLQGRGATYNDFVGAAPTR